MGIFYGALYVLARPWWRARLAPHQSDVEGCTLGHRPAPDGRVDIWLEGIETWNDQLAEVADAILERDAWRWEPPRLIYRYFDVWPWNPVIEDSPADQLVRVARASRALDLTAYLGEVAAQGFHPNPRALRLLARIGGYDAARGIIADYLRKRSSIASHILAGLFDFMDREHLFELVVDTAIRIPHRCEMAEFLCDDPASLERLWSLWLAHPTFISRPIFDRASDGGVHAHRALVRAIDRGVASAVGTAFRCDGSMILEHVAKNWDDDVERAIVHKPLRRQNLKHTALRLLGEHGRLAETEAALEDVYFRSPAPVHDTPGPDEDPVHVVFHAAKVNWQGPAAKQALDAVRARRARKKY